jgi:diacylglycerol kinase family enzyme
LIVANATSGPVDGQQNRLAIEAVLTKAGQTYRILPVNAGDDVMRVAKQAADEAQNESGAVIVAGGDGTINAVAQWVLPTRRPFGIIPQGTFNYSARAHGIPLDTEAATRSLLDAHCTPVQVGLLNGRVFLVNASLGLYPESLQDREAFKKQYGRYRLVALWAAVATLLRERRNLVLSIEHDRQQEIVRTVTLFVGNNPLQLQQAGLPAPEGLRASQLSAVIVRPISTAGLLWLALRGAMGQLGDDRNIRGFVFRRLVVEPRLRRREVTIKVATDGEVWNARPPLEFSVAEQPLLLMTPASSADS